MRNEHNDKLIMHFEHNDKSCCIQCTMRKSWCTFFAHHEILSWCTCAQWFSHFALLRIMRVQNEVQHEKSSCTGATWLVQNEVQHEESRCTLRIMSATWLVHNDSLCAHDALLNLAWNQKILRFGVCFQPKHLIRVLRAPLIPNDYGEIL
jgi:hypothetical protein